MTLPEHTVIPLVEDLPNDVLLIRRALNDAGVTNHFHVVGDGEECLACLHGTRKYANREEYPVPNLLLLDLKIPKVDGFEVLRTLRGDKAFTALPIIILTASGQVADINKAYELGANSFLVKPLEFENLAAMMRTLSSFWFHQSKSPTTDHPFQSK